LGIQPLALHSTWTEERFIRTSHPSDVRDLTVVEVLDAIGSAQPSSGAGISAALTLALATACALKAIHVTLKHTDDAKLRDRGQRLERQRDRAVDRARVDAELFQRYLKTKEPRDAALLVKAAEDFQALAREVLEEIEGLDSCVRPTVVADVTAALALHSAAMQIEGVILHESRELRARTMP
jgi:formiminotetrahydrofolate cyclodeaminase